METTLPESQQRRPSAWTEVIAHFLVIGAMAALVFGECNYQRVDAERQRHLRQYGEIDVPQAFAFDSEAVMGGLPMFLIWLGLQIASAVFGGLNWGRMRLVPALSFWALWLLSSAFVIGMFICAGRLI